MRGMSVASVLIVCVLCLTGCGLETQTSPTPMLNAKQAEEFGYEFQRMLMDVKESGNRVLVLSDNRANLHVYGPATIDAVSGGPFSWTVLHGSGEEWAIAAYWRGKPLTVAKQSDLPAGQTTISVDIPDLANQLGNDSLVVTLTQAGRREYRFAVRVTGLGPGVGIDGRSIVLVPRADPNDSTKSASRLADFRNEEYKWTISNPRKQTITAALTTGEQKQPASNQPPGSKAMGVTNNTPITSEVKANGRDFEVPGTYQIVVRDADAKVVAAKAVESKLEPKAKDGWIRATFTMEDQLTSEKNFGNTFAKCFYCIQVSMTNGYEKPVTIQSASIQLPIDFVSRLTPASGAIGIDEMRRITRAIDTKEYLIEYAGSTYVVFNSKRSPMNFTAILSAFEFDRRHDPRQVFIDMLRAAGVIAAAVPAFASTGSSYSPIVSFIQGPVTETLANALLSDLVAHLNYINANAMHDSVSLEALGSANKYVFFPRGDIFGAWGLELPMRIMALKQEQAAELSGTVQVEQQTAEVKK
jgi:hypothetical protein